MQNFKNKMKFRDDLDNDEEDEFSDEEWAAGVKMEKCKLATKRADILMEHFAICDVINGV